MKISQIPSVYFIQVFNILKLKVTFVSKFEEKVSKKRPSVQLLIFQFKKVIPEKQYQSGT